MDDAEFESLFRVAVAELPKHWTYDKTVALSVTRAFVAEMERRQKLDAAPPAPTTADELVLARRLAGRVFATSAAAGGGTSDLLALICVRLERIEQKLKEPRA